MSNTITVVPTTALEQQEKDLYEFFLSKQKEADEAKSAWGQVYHQLRELQQEQAFRAKVEEEVNVRVDAEVKRRMLDSVRDKRINQATP